MRFTNLQILQKYTATFYKTAHIYQKCTMEFHWKTNFYLKQQKGKKQPKTSKNNSIKIFIHFLLVNQNILRILGENRNVEITLKDR